MTPAPALDLTTSLRGDFARPPGALTFPLNFKIMATRYQIEQHTDTAILSMTAHKTFHKAQ